MPWGLRGSRAAWFQVPPQAELGLHSRLLGAVPQAREHRKLAQCPPPPQRPMPGALVEVDPLKAAELPLRLEVGPQVAPGLREAPACVPGKARLKAGLRGGWDEHGGCCDPKGLPPPPSGAPSQSPLTRPQHPFPAPPPPSYTDDQRPFLCRKQKPKLSVGFFLCRLPYPLLIPLPIPAPGWKPSPT